MSKQLWWNYQKRWVKKRRLSWRFLRVARFYCVSIGFDTLRGSLAFLNDFLERSGANRFQSARYHPGEEPSSTQDAISKEKTRRASRHSPFSSVPRVFPYRASFPRLGILAYRKPILDRIQMKANEHTVRYVSPFGLKELRWKLTHRVKIT